MSKAVWPPVWLRYLLPAATCADDDPAAIARLYTSEDLAVPGDLIG